MTAAKLKYKLERWWPFKNEASHIKRHKTYEQWEVASQNICIEFMPCQEYYLALGDRSAVRFEKILLMTAVKLVLERWRPFKSETSHIKRHKTGEQWEVASQNTEGKHEQNSKNCTSFYNVD